tara:strand:+ start:11315 stop:12106 length:792 start_codon:yes stop_codon:yes gene_type:complete
MKDRIELIEEQLLRENIRKIIKTSRKKRTETEALEESTLRSVIRGIIQEKIAINDEVPHEKTGINKLRRTLKKVIPQIRDDYLTLTTDPAQRKSYIAHLVNGVDNLLAPIETNIDAPDSPKNNASLEEDMDEQIDIEVGGDDDQFIDIGDDILPSEEEEEIEIDDEEELVTRGLDSKENDETGRNEAIATFKQIQGTIVDDFGTLANDEDRELYHDYLKTNILLWKDRFEEVLSTNQPEPTTPEYEKEKDQEKKEDMFEILDI